MKKNVVMTMIVFLTISFTLSAQDTNSRRGGEENRRQLSERLETRQIREARERATHARAADQERTARPTRSAIITRQLVLTEEQTLQVRALFENQHSLFRNRSQESQLSRRDNRVEMRELWQQAMIERNAELENIIGSENLAEWQGRRSDRIRPDGDRREGIRPEGVRADRDSSERVRPEGFRDRR